MGKVLLVDDSFFTLQRHANIFRGLGHQVDMASNVKDGLEQFDSNTYDLIVTDLLMPDEDGMALIKEIKNRKNIQKVVVVSVDRRDQSKKKALGAGAKDLIPKPLNREKAAKMLVEFGIK